MDSKKPSESGNNFECTICLDTAKEPVLTKCGHMFCWPCIYNWLDSKGGKAKCPNCKNEIFINNASDTVCDGCGKKYVVNNTFKVNGYSVVIAKGTRIYRCQLGICNADEALDPVGCVISHPEAKEVLAFQNLTGSTMIGASPGGKVNQVPPGGMVPIKSGIKLQAFGNNFGIM